MTDENMQHEVETGRHLLLGCSPGRVRWSLLNVKAVAKKHRYKYLIVKYRVFSGSLRIDLCFESISA